MSVQAYKIDDGKDDVVVHRNFDGVHEDSDNCWCRPEVIKAGSEESAESIVDRLEQLDG